MIIYVYYFERNRKNVNKTYNKNNLYSVCLYYFVCVKFKKSKIDLIHFNGNIAFVYFLKMKEQNYIFFFNTTPFEIN